MPEYRLSVDSAQVPSIISADQPRRHGLQVVDQLAQLYRRVRLNQQVDMIGFAVELDQFTSPFLQRLQKNHAQSFEHPLRDRFAARFCH
jgi:hypothetical protein